MGERTHATGNDLIVRGGDVVDGSGSARFRADLRVRDGRIVECGADLAPDGEPEIDASGAVVTPGFIDSHTHADPQVFWDPALDPEPLHGVTSMLVGNCSLSLHPVTESSRATMADLFSYIEDVPRDLFDSSVPWSWTNFEGYRDAVNATGSGINLACLVGHSPLRLFVMGDDAWSRPATASERTAMSTLLREAMDAGAWGLSTSFFDHDEEGRPVPSLAADDAELAALLDVIQDLGRGVVQVVPALFESDATSFDMLARLCGARDIPLTWVGFNYSGTDPSRTERFLEQTRRLASEGARTYPQMSPRPIDLRLNWGKSMMFMAMPESWNRVITSPPAEKAGLLRDPEWRARAREDWDRVEIGVFPHRRLETVQIVEVVGPQNEEWLGRTLADVVAAKGGHPSDVFADFVAANDCRPGIVATAVSNADPDGVARTMADPSVIIGASDAGAHCQMSCASGDQTLLLTRFVRERGDFSLERAVHEISGRQSEVFGFRERGTVAVGNRADLAVFALDELHYDPYEFVSDLPNGGSRLRRPEGGYRATIVDGVPVQIDGALTGALPGRVISSAP